MRSSSTLASPVNATNTYDKTGKCTLMIICQLKPGCGSYCFLQGSLQPVHLLYMNLCFQMRCLQDSWIIEKYRMHVKMKNLQVMMGDFCFVLVSSLLHIHTAIFSSLRSNRCITLLLLTDFKDFRCRQRV